MPLKILLSAELVLAVWTVKNLKSPKKRLMNLESLTKDMYSLVQNFLVSLEVEYFPPALVTLHNPGLVKPLHVHVEASPVGEGDIVTSGTLERSVIAVNINPFSSLLSLELLVRSCSLEPFIQSDHK